MSDFTATTADTDRIAMVVDDALDLARLLYSVLANKTASVRITSPYAQPVTVLFDHHPDIKVALSYLALIDLPGMTTSDYTAEVEDGEVEHESITVTWLGNSARPAIRFAYNKKY